MTPIYRFFNWDGAQDGYGAYGFAMWQTLHTGPGEYNVLTLYCTRWRKCSFALCARQALPERISTPGDLEAGSPMPTEQPEPSPLTRTRIALGCPTTAAFAAGANELHIGSLNIQRISLIVVAVSPFAQASGQIADPGVQTSAQSLVETFEHPLLARHFGKHVINRIGDNLVFFC